MEPLAVALTISGVAVFTALAWRRPDHGFLAVVALLPFERVGSYALAADGSTTVRVVQVAGLGLLLAASLKMMIRNKQLWLPRLPLPLWLFVGSTLVSAVLMNHPRVWQNYLSSLFVIAVFGIVAHYARLVQQALVLKVLFASAVVVSLLGVYQYVGDLAGLPTEFTLLRESYTKVVLGYPRLQSVAIEPLNFANYLLLPLSLSASVWLYVKDKRLSRRAAMSGLICLLVFMLTTSRGAFLSLGAASVAGAFILGIARKSPQKRRLLGLVGVGIGLVLSTIVITGAASYVTRGSFLAGPRQLVELTLTKFTSNASFQDRSAGSAQAEEAWRKNPIWGVGLGKPGVSPLGAPPKRMYYDQINPINSWWELLCEAGLVGTGLFVWFLCLLGYKGIKALQLAQDSLDKAVLAGLIVALLAILIQAASFSAYYVTYIWVALGLLWGYSQARTIST